MHLQVFASRYDFLDKIKVSQALAGVTLRSWEAVLSMITVHQPPWCRDSILLSPSVTTKTVCTESRVLSWEKQLSGGRWVQATARQSVPGPAHNISWELVLNFRESSKETVKWIISKTIIKYQNAQSLQLKSLGYLNLPWCWCCWAHGVYSRVFLNVFSLVSHWSLNCLLSECLQMFINATHQATHSGQLGVRRLSKQDFFIWKEVSNSC